MDRPLIRAARGDDVDALRDVFRRASLSNDADRPLFDAHPEYLEWSPSARLDTRVAVVEGHVAGFASTSAGDDAVELDDLFVAPERMRSGVGRALVADAVERARAAGATAIEVTGNEHAVAFYRAVGFVVVGSAPTAGPVAPRLRLDLASPR